MIESLDLSHNRLSGRIPPQLTELNFLSNFNVSYNNLSGPTPDKGQFGTFDENNYKGNLYLCGSLIKRKCSSAETPTATPAGKEEGEDESAISMVALYWSFGATYATPGASILCWTDFTMKLSSICLASSDFSASVLHFLEFESQGSRLCWENLCLSVRAGTSSLGCGTSLKTCQSSGQARNTSAFSQVAEDRRLQLTVELSRSVLDANIFTQL
ncbi:hypothetical protein WN943_022578 [Citrus x changshan-huyou]